MGALTNRSDIERALRSASLYDNEAVTSHLEDETIAERLDTGEFTPEEREHLAACEECREVVASLAQTPMAEVTPLFSARRVAMLTTVLAIAAGVAFAFVPRDEHYQGSKGATADLTASVAVLVTDSTGRTRAVLDGGVVTTAERIGFTYGNPDGKHRTVTIVGWDGHRLHWYFPEGPQPTGHPIAGGKGAVSVRLAEEIELDDHAPGKLEIVAAFDVSPETLAAAVSSGRSLDGHRGVTYRLELRAAAP